MGLVNLLLRYQNFDIWPIKCGIPSLLELSTAVSNQFTHKNRIFELTFDDLIHRGSRSLGCDIAFVHNIFATH
mgnify:CR=1 FL=1